MRVEISAVPFPGFDSFRRAGRRWSAEPTPVTVIDSDPMESLLVEEKDDQKRDALRKQFFAERVERNEITRAELAILEASPNIKVRYVDAGLHAASQPEQPPVVGGAQLGNQPPLQPPSPPPAPKGDGKNEKPRG